MAIRFGGEFRVPRKPEEVYAFLTDPKRFAPLLPEFDGMTPQDDRNCTVNVKVGVAHIRGTANVQLHLAEAEPSRRAVYHGKGSMAGGTVNLTAGFDLAPDTQGTRVQWNGEAQLYGRLVSLAGGLLEPLARKNVQKLIDGLQKALS